MAARGVPVFSLALLVACSSDAKDVMGGGHDTAGGAGGASTIGASGSASGGADASGQGGTPAMTGRGGAAMSPVGGASGQAASGGSGQGPASGGVGGGSSAMSMSGGGANATGGSGAAGGATGGGGSGGAGATDFALMPVGATMLQSGEFAFPATAIPPTNQSPEFTWRGVPSAAKSLALVFRDLSGGAVKWILWDIPPTVNHLPANIGNTPNPSQVAGSSQLGSLGNQGYAGPCCTDHTYEFVLWALDVEKLPGTAGQSTKTIRDTLIDMHDVASTEPVSMRIMP